MPYAMGEYYEQVNDYDLEYQSQSEQDLPFWRELVMRYTPSRVLELACGSGRIGLELLHAPGDFVLEGLDIEQGMLPVILCSKAWTLSRACWMPIGAS